MTTFQNRLFSRADPASSLGPQGLIFLLLPESPRQILPSALALLHWLSHPPDADSRHWRPTSTCQSSRIVIAPPSHPWLFRALVPIHFFLPLAPSEPSLVPVYFFIKWKFQKGLSLIGRILSNSLFSKFRPRPLLSFTFCLTSFKPLSLISPYV